MPSPTYGPLLRLSGDQAWPWGLAFLIVGGLMIIPLIQLCIVALSFAVLLLNLFGAMFLVAVARFDTSASTAPFAYFGLGMVCAGLLAEKIICQRRLSKKTW